MYIGIYREKDMPLDLFPPSEEALAIIHSGHTIAPDDKEKISTASPSYVRINTLRQTTLPDWARPTSQTAFDGKLAACGKD